MIWPFNKLIPTKKVPQGALLKNPFLDRDAQAEYFLSPGALQIYQFIDRALVDREDDSNVLRASAAPQCVRRRWLQARGIKGARMAPRSIVNFILGDVYEHTIKHLIKSSCVGTGKLYSEVSFGEHTGTFTIQRREFDIHQQIEVTTKIGPLTITGHLDGIGKRNSDGRWEFIEAKSSSDYGFEKFKKSGPNEYLKQAHATMMSDLAYELGVTETRYFYGRKQSGHLHDRLISFDESIAEITRQEYSDSMAPAPPAPPHTLTVEMKSGLPTGRLIALSFPCGFCPYINTPHCHHGLEKKHRNDNGGNRRPIYVYDPRKVMSGGNVEVLADA